MTKRLTVRRRTLMGLACAWAAPAWAQKSGTGEGFEYKAVQPLAPVQAPAGKIEVVEFFWYGCPHCAALEPLLPDWIARLPADVVFRKVHVPWQVKAHQQLFFTLEAMGQAQALQAAVFKALHVDRIKLDQPDAMADWIAQHGQDRRVFLETYRSFGVRTKMQAATQLAAAYRIDGVPAFGVGGRWLTAPSMVGSNQGALKVVDLLIDRTRRGG
jgi:thiol:disulfide interchange protein DsbA